mgnify:CR=1 FL=1
MTGVVANVDRPGLSEIPEANGVAGEQCAVSFLVIAPVPSDGGKEAIGRFLPCAQCVALATRLARFFDELAQCDGGASWLGIEPVPVAGKQRDLARHHAHAGPTTSPGLRSLDQFGFGLRRWCGGRRRRGAEESR